VGDRRGEIEKEVFMKNRIRVACALGISFLAAAAFAALMQHSETTIPVPAAGEKTPLEKLEYRARFVASIDSVTLQAKSAAGANPVLLDWVFAGSNTDGQAHRVEVAVRLLDESGKQLEVFSTTRVLPPGAHGMELTLTTKVKADAWSAARKARIFADWRS
jgi:hypothetical protein